MRTSGKQYWIAVLLAVCSLGGSGCALVRRGAAKAITPVASQLTDGLMHQGDLDLVREGAPAFLLVLDALAEAHPDNPTVLVAAAEAQMAYATGFVATDNPPRAKLMYNKARTYGIRALSKNKRFARALEGTSQDAFEDSLRSFKVRDAQALFTTAASWVMWIIASADSPVALGDLPKVMALIARVRELEPNIRQGGIDMFYGIYYTVLPLGGGRDLAKAKAHFERSMDIAGPDYLLPRVTYAEFYARYAFDEDLFETTLNDVLAATPTRPEFTLLNSVAKTRAQALLDRMEELF